MIVAGSCLEPVPIDGKRCNADQPCGDDYACVGGTCRQLEGTVAAPCVVDSDCPQVPVALVCLTAQGVCLACIDDEDCGTGACFKDDKGDKTFNYCVDCIVNADCEKTHFCDDKVCRACDADTQCDQGFTCKGGLCLQNVNEGPGHAE